MTAIVFAKKVDDHHLVRECLLEIATFTSLATDKRQIMIGVPGISVANTMIGIAGTLDESGKGTFMKEVGLTEIGQVVIGDGVGIPVTEGGIVVGIGTGTDTITGPHMVRLYCLLFSNP